MFIHRDEHENEKHRPTGKKTGKKRGRKWEQRGRQSRGQSKREGKIKTPRVMEGDALATYGLLLLEFTTVSFFTFGHLTQRSYKYPTFSNLPKLHTDSAESLQHVCDHEALLSSMYLHVDSH